MQAGGNPGGSSWGDGQRLADEGGELGRVRGLGTAETVESRGVSGMRNTGAWEDTEIQGGTREARELGGSWRIQGGTRKKYGS